MFLNLQLHKRALKQPFAGQLKDLSAFFKPKKKIKSGELWPSNFTDTRSFILSPFHSVK
jgi:hypothetical protein